MEAIIAKPETKDQLKALKAFLKAMDISFTDNEKQISKAIHNAEYAAKLKRGVEDLGAGRSRKVSLDEIWK